MRRILQQWLNICPVPGHFLASEQNKHPLNPAVEVTCLSMGGESQYLGNTEATQSISQWFSVQAAPRIILKVFFKNNSCMTLSLETVTFSAWESSLSGNVLKAPQVIPPRSWTASSALQTPTADDSLGRYCKTHRQGLVFLTTSQFLPKLFVCRPYAEV